MMSGTLDSVFIVLLYRCVANFGNSSLAVYEVFYYSSSFEVCIFIK